MAFLRRLSDNFWSYVSPTKTTTPNALPTPNSEPTFKKPAIPARRASLHDISKHTRSMSPGERVGNWRIRSPSSRASSSVLGNKRKRLYTPSSIAGRRSKSRKFDLDDMESRYEEEEGDYDDDVLMEDGYDDESDIQSPITRQQLRSSSAGLGDEGDEDNLSMHKTVVASEEDYEPARRVVNLPEMLDMGHIATDELRLKGWDDDYITLIQKIATRGYEPLLPAYLQFEYSFMPDGLFEEGDDAFIASTRGEHFKAGKALEQLLELGGRVRDRIYVGGRIQPEDQVRRQLEAYMKWAFTDADIDNRSAIPILAVETQPAGTEAPILRASALRKCRRLAARYREALRVRRSVEISPGSRSSEGTLLSYPLPTFYTVIASHGVVALMAYRPDAEESDLAAMAYFDFKDKNYDVWNCLALAIIVCHVRNVQVRIAEETGLGLRQQGYSEDEAEEDDPDA
ncbi:hypothetical protein M409DRAFT_26970 [Zasmidium cellare ATCC 36951]|uniref:Uncharacterized protein n=1 Tax=Zasmidium cellare ATCC 36951 TaxID=1080233 RepID=A0A6A6C7B6_ZASCE|nr:uncharacterized protein M409DRAFT_26970 [Zasmidium cellare ATCC 36951]KAF2162733.1 hypothetical protein M409DRAFT_26970 [Zasmidium cellare ATCC 36951]